MFLAGVAHPVERHLAKVEVASSSLVTRSIEIKTSLLAGLYFYDVGDDGSNNYLQGSGGALLAAGLDGGDSLRGEAEAPSLVTRSDAVRSGEGLKI